MNILGSGLKGWLQDETDEDELEKQIKSNYKPLRKDLTLTAAEAEDPGVTVCTETGEVMLDDPESPQAEIWLNFKAWSTHAFQDSEDMMQKFLGTARLIVEGDKVPCLEFCEYLQDSLWPSHFEGLLFRMITGSAAETGMTLEHCKWLDIEKRRQARKEKAREKAQTEATFRTNNQIAQKMVLVKFKAMLKQTHGSYLRAWRVALSPHDSMVLQKAQFFKACSEMGWSGDVRKLWKSLGKGGRDETVGSHICIDDWDPKTAEILAHFRAWISINFPKGSAEAFNHLDRCNKKSVHLDEFLVVLQESGFSKPAKTLFHGLDKRGTKTLVAEDLLFLDRWRPPGFLLATPNQGAVDLFKAMLLSRYRSYLLSWRKILDTDNSNRCDWTEFQIACNKHLQFTGDMPGAWRALDKDLVGYITLAQIDAHSAETLRSFKEWSTKEFGSVRSAFQVFDTNASGDISIKEFQHACRMYDFDGKSAMIFRALDVERNYSLSIEEVAFLDDWQSEDMVTSHLEDGAGMGFMPQVTPRKAQTLKIEPPVNIKVASNSSNARRRAYTCMPTPERVW